MPSKKNQHFVPKVYFRPFSTDREGKAVNIFNIEQGMCINNASIKGQCSRSYFYGKDMVIEDGLGFFESKYSSVLHSIESGNILTSDDEEALRVFILVQYLRTEAAANLMASTMGRGRDYIYTEQFSDQRPPMIPKEKVVMLALKLAFSKYRVMEDLKLCILCNKTNVDFLTSDNPVNLINKWQLQKNGEHSFGLSSS